MEEGRSIDHLRLWKMKHIDDKVDGLCVGGDSSGLVCIKGSKGEAMITLTNY